MDSEIVLSVNRAMIGEIPPSLRFLCVWKASKSLHFHAVFSDDAKDNHLEYAHRISTEVLSDMPSNYHFEEVIIRDDMCSWRELEKGSLMYLRYGELQGF